MKKKHPEHVNLERWLVSYADFITLLFAFFVVMYAMSQADVSKLKKVSESLQRAFGAEVSTIDIQGKSGGSTINILDSSEVKPRIEDMPIGKFNTASEPDPEIQDIHDKLEETISLELGLSNIADKPELIFDSRGLVIRLAMKDFYEFGKVEIDQDLRPLLDRIGRVLGTTNQHFRVEGHSDSSEAKVGDSKAGGAYPTDWELSSARAAWVARYWMERFKIDPRRIGVAGYSHYRPVAEEKTDWGRRANRRIEVVILNNRYREDRGPGPAPGPGPNPGPGSGPGK